MPSALKFDETRSPAQRLRDTGRWEEVIGKLDNNQIAGLLLDWRFFARPCQLEPTVPHDYWGFLGGRGTGKTRSGAEWVRENVENHRARRIAIVAPTAGDARDVMIEGESGLRAVFPASKRPEYFPTKRLVTFHNGAQATLFTAKEPDRLRGPQHDLAWADEAAAWENGKDTLDNLLLGLRLGNHPRMLITTTPKPVPWLRSFLEQDNAVVTNGTTMDNIANLAPSFIQAVLDRYEGTSLGRQELMGEWLESVEGALWSLDNIEKNRWEINSWKRTNEWRVVVGVDPPGEATAEAGIVVAAGPVRPVNGAEAVVLADVSVRGRPEEWGRRVVDTVHEFGASAAVVESNQGGDMVRSVIHSIDPNVPVKKVRATDSKKERAEPVAAKYELDRVHHVGYFAQMESQMVSYVEGDKISPDRMDALVHAISELLPDRAFPAKVETMSDKYLRVSPGASRRRFLRGQ